MKVAGEVLAGMADAMLGTGAKLRARGLHPTEHAQLSGMLEAWRERGAMPSLSLEGIAKQLTVLRPGDAGSSEDGIGGPTRSSMVRAQSKNKRAAWVRVPAAAAVRSAGDSPGAATSGPAGVGRLSPTRPSSGGGGGGNGGSRLPVAPQTESERQAGLEAALKELLSRNVAVAGGWWAQAFQGSGPFPQGPEGCWSLQFRRANEDPGNHQNQVRGLLGANGGYYRRDSGVDPGGVKTEAVDGMDSDAAPSTPSTVPSEASPSPERASPLPAEKVEESKDAEAKPAVGGGKNGTKVAPDDGKAPQHEKDPGSKEGRADGAKAPRSPKKPALSKREEEEEERRRRKDEARRAGKEKGKAKALERERQKKAREVERQKMIAESRKKKADEEAARKEKEAKHKADELARRSSSRTTTAEEEGQREKSRRRDQPEEAKGSADQPKGDASAEKSRRDHRGGSSRSRERQERTKDREGRDRAGGVDGKASARDSERAGGGGGGSGGSSGSGSGRDKDERRRRGSSGDNNRGRSDREGRGARDKDKDKDKGTDRASSRRDKDESRRHHDRGESREAAARGGSRGRQDQHEQPRVEDREAGDDWQKRGSSSQRAREADLAAAAAADGGRRALDGRERESGDKGERKRRRSDPSESDGVSRYYGEHAEDDRSSSRHRPSKKKSKKDKRDRKEKRAERHSDAATTAAARLAARASSEESTRGRKRSRDFDGGGGPPPEGYAAAALQGDPGRRSLDPHRQRQEPELGRNGSEARDQPRQAVGRSTRRDSASPRRGDRRDGSEKRARRGGGGGGGGDISSVHSRPGASGERHSRGAGRESAVGSSSSGMGGGGGDGLPGMEGYSSAASPPVGAELGGFGSGQGVGSLKALDAYGPALGSRSDSPDAGRRRRGNGARDSGGRPRLAAAGDAYGPGMDDSSRSGARSERDHSERDRSERDRSDRDRLERDRSERDRSERDYSRSADKSLRESSGRRGDAGSRQPSSSNVSASNRWYLTLYMHYVE